MLGRIDWENMVIYSVGDGVMPPDSISPAQARVRAKGPLPMRRMAGLSKWQTK